MSLSWEKQGSQILGFIVRIFQLYESSKTAYSKMFFFFTSRFYKLQIYAQIYRCTDISSNHDSEEKMTAQQIERVKQIPMKNKELSLEMMQVRSVSFINVLLSPCKIWIIKPLTSRVRALTENLSAFKTTVYSPNELPPSRVSAQLCHFLPHFLLLEHASQFSSD